MVIYDEARERLLGSLNANNVSQSVAELARALRDEGMGQAALFRLFSVQQQRCSPAHPRYDVLVDTMDLIWGGGWAKGRALFEHELSDERLAKE